MREGGANTGLPLDFSNALRTAVSQIRVADRVRKCTTTRAHRHSIPAPFAYLFQALQCGGCLPLLQIVVNSCT